ncbi:hypothetical protein Sjap_012013 [Stephania japonica]|uniref:BHLH domain-containing protein n=1 Tax=Stephania japonica TaxID=461633 RepID=A0AAP0JCD6_9MAGN
MDEFLDQFLSSSPWSDANITEKLSWVGNGSAVTNGLLTDSLGNYKGDAKNFPISLITGSHITESLTAQNTSMLDGDGCGSNYVPLQKDGLNNSSLSGILNGNCKYMGELTNSVPNLSKVNNTSSELLSAAGVSSKSAHMTIESGSVGSNDSETSGFQSCHIDSQPLTSMPPLWPSSSHGDVSSLPPVAMHDKPQIFGLQGEYMGTDANVLHNRYDDKILQIGDLPAPMHVNGRDELHNHQYLPSFSTGQHNQLADMLSEGNTVKYFADQSSVSQLQHASNVTAGNCNGVAKPRMRARRGQATDPHSIAERLRREKIAERMKNLQELVPNSNKTDKASMLDEIIEYVKFLQLQVKVLSMSRLGAAGAVVPLITDKSEGSAGLILSQSNGVESDPFESPDNIAFEEEVAKLMESNMTTAMQFLQSKGLCIMPIALATAISGRKPSSGPIAADPKKPIPRNGLAYQNNGPSTGNSQMSSDANGGTNDCNGQLVKQEK